VGLLPPPERAVEIRDDEVDFGHHSEHALPVRTRARVFGTLKHL
jgi:hypothetical protein